MDAQLEKAKDILFGKTFCFMQWQTYDAKTRGEKVMEKEDIEYILSLEGLQKGSILSLDGTDDRFFSPNIEPYIPGNLFQHIDFAKSKEFKGVSIIEKDITPDEDAKVKQMGGHTNYTWAGGSTKLCDIYFSEEAFVLSQISHLQNLFGCLATAIKAGYL